MCWHITDTERRYRRYMECELISGICWYHVRSGNRYFFRSYDYQLHIANGLLQDIRDDGIAYPCGYRWNAERMFWLNDEPEPQHERWCMVEQQCGCSVSESIGRSDGRYSRQCYNFVHIAIRLYRYSDSNG